MFSFANPKYEDLSIKRNFSQKNPLWSLHFLFENVDLGLTDLAKLFGSNPCKETLEDFVKAFNRTVTELFEDNTGNVATLVLSYIKSVSGMFH